MKTFLIRLWTGEPIFVFGLISTILVVASQMAGAPDWLGWIAALWVAASTFVARNEVTSKGEVTGLAVLRG